jgi:hypothetical protein
MLGNGLAEGAGVVQRLWSDFADPQVSGDALHVKSLDVSATKCTMCWGWKPSVFAGISFAICSESGVLKMI